MGYWQSQYTVPTPILITAHHGASPEARLVEVPNNVAAARAAPPNISFARVFNTTRPSSGFLSLFLNKTPQWQNKSKLPSFSPHLSTATSPQIAAQVLEIGVGEFLRLRRAHSEQYDGWKNRKHTNVALRGFGLRGQNQCPVGGSIP